MLQIFVRSGIVIGIKNPLNDDASAQWPLPNPITNPRELLARPRYHFDPPGHTTLE